MTTGFAHSSSNDLAVDPPRIVILGGGFAGVAVAQRLEKKLRPHEAEIAIVSRENFTLFTPMLPEVSAGGIETRHIVTPVRSQLKRSTFVLGEITDIDLGERSVEARHPITGDVIELSYDHLVLALGSVYATFGIPGVTEHTLPLKTIEDAEALRNRIIAALEQAVVTPAGPQRDRMLTFVVVGGGYTGCEAAGELVDLFHSIVPFYRPLKLADVKMVLIEAGKALLPDLPAKMGEYTTRDLQHRRVELILGDGVKEIDADGVSLHSGRRIPSATMLWSAGVRPSPVLKDLPGVVHARNGGIVARRDMTVIGADNVWAIGDCAWIPKIDDAQQSDRGAWYPQTAQHAIREGPALADNLIATLRGAPTKPFAYTSMGTMASLGARRGVAALPGGFVLTGFLAWMLWRTYYLARLPGLDRRLRVTIDWTLGLLFPRDIAEMRLYTTRGPQAEMEQSPASKGDSA